MNPLAIKVLIVIFIISGASYKSYTKGYTNGHNQAENTYLKEKTQAVARAIKQVNQLNSENAEIAQEYWQTELAKKPKVRTIEKRIIKYVEKQTKPQPNNPKTIVINHCDLDDDELYILQDLTSIANGDPTATSRPSTTTNMPQSNTTNKQNQRRTPAMEKTPNTAIRHLQGQP